MFSESIKLKVLLLACSVLVGPACGSIWGQPSAFEGGVRVQALSVTIDAVSTSIQAGGQKQDTYLAELVSKSRDPQLVKLIDVYPAYDTRIDRNLLSKLPLLRMKVARAAFCDVTAKEVFFSRDSIVFDKAMKTEIAAHPSATLPCFRIVHRSVKLKIRSSPKAIAGT